MNNELPGATPRTTPVPPEFAAYAAAVIAHRTATGQKLYPVRYMVAEHRSAYQGHGA